MTVERESPVTSMTSVRVTARPSRISRRTPPGEPDADRGKVVIGRHVTANPQLLLSNYAEVWFATHLIGNLLLARYQQVGLRSRPATT